ncbi:hypothetical protein KQI63_02580 [bacterium]|nr:hypothetical protein [bacterium]
MTQQKTKWSSSRELEYAEDGVVRHGDRVMPKASRVIRGGQYHVVEETSTAVVHPPAAPKAVAQGKIQLESLAKSAVRVAYDPARYGLGKVETLEEREARFQADVARLKEEADKREEAAFAKGRDEGYQQGMVEGKQAVAASVAQIVEFLESIRKETRSYFHHVERRLVNFSMAIARKVVGDTAEHNREVAVKLASEAIQQSIERTKVILWVNSADAQSLQESRADLLALSEGIKDIDIQISQRVSPGGVILESAGGSIDATIETILDEVHLALIPEPSNSQAEREKGGSG